MTGYDVPYPYWQIEDAYMPSPARVVDAARAARLLVALHELPLESAVLHGYFSRELEPVLTVDGDSVRMSVPDAGWDTGRDTPFGSRDPELDTGHALAGPIEVRGARARAGARRADRRGRAGAVGRHAERAPTRIDWELAEGVGRGAGRSVRLAPFLGVLGMPAGQASVHSHDSPRRCGGNRLQGTRRGHDALRADSRRRRPSPPATATRAG